VAISNDVSSHFKVDEDALDKLDRCLAKGSIQSITLARCELDDHVVSKIAKMLQSDQWQCLRSLSLDGNPSISDEGAKSLAKGLAENKTLEDLSLWGTGIGDEGAKAIAESLKQNCTLRNLWLGECENIQDTGAQALLTCLESNKTLQQLALVCTAVSEELQNEIEDVVQAGRT